MKIGRAAKWLAGTRFVNLAPTSDNHQRHMAIYARRKKCYNKDKFNQKGHAVLKNASVNAIEQAQEDFRGAAEAAGIKTDEDIMNLVREIRHGESVA